MTIESIGMAYIFLIGLFLLAVIFIGIGRAARYVLRKTLRISLSQARPVKLESAEVEAFPGERRNDVRIEARGYIAAKTSWEKDGRPLQVTNISLGGLMMKTSTKFKVGETIELNIQLPFSPETVDITAKIVRVDVEGSRHLSNRFSVAAQFTSMKRSYRQKLAAALEALVNKSSQNAYERR